MEDYLKLLILWTPFWGITGMYHQAQLVYKILNDKDLVIFTCWHNIYMLIILLHLHVDMHVNLSYLSEHSWILMDSSQGPQFCHIVMFRHVIGACHLTT